MTCVDGSIVYLDSDNHASDLDPQASPKLH